MFRRAEASAGRQPSVVVRYLVASKGAAGFQGEIQVTNNTAQPIWNWQIVVTLYDDAVTSFTNADGFFSNGILVLSPASPAQVAPPRRRCAGRILHRRRIPDHPPGLRLRRDLVRIATAALAAWPVRRA